MKRQDFQKLSKKEQEKHIKQLAAWYRHMDSEQAGSDLPSLDYYIEIVKKELKGT